MNIVITGEVKSGKTTFCFNLLKLLKNKKIKCRGILCPRNKIINLKTGEEKTFLTRTGKNIYKCIKVGKCYIFKDGMNFAIKSLEDSEDCDVVFIDEYGPLETRKLGLYNTMRRILNEKNSKLIVMRRLLVNKFVTEFSDFDFKFFEIDKNKENNKENEKLLEEISSLIIPLSC